MNHSNSEEFQAFIGQGVKDEHIDRAISEILSPQESLLAIIKQVTKAKFTSRFIIITNQRVIPWNQQRSDWIYFPFDIITNVYGEGAYINGMLVIVTNDGKTHKYLTRRGENDIAARMLQQQLQYYYDSKQNMPLQNTSGTNSNRFCTSCGTENMTTNKFCTKCGKQV